MKIVIASSMYPPEIDRTAWYVKRVAETLSASHEVTVVTYAGTNEPTPGVKVLSVSKRQSLMRRLTTFYRTLAHAAQGADVLYVEHSLAASLPAWLLHWSTRIPLVYHFLDDESWKRATHRRLTQSSLQDYLRHPDPRWALRRIRALQGFLLRRGERVVVEGPGTARLLTNVYRLDPRRLTVVPTPCEPREILPFPVERDAALVTVVLPKTDTLSAAVLRAVLEAVEFRTPTPVLQILGSGPEVLDRPDAEKKRTVPIAALGYTARTEETYAVTRAMVAVIVSTDGSPSHALFQALHAGTPVILVVPPDELPFLEHERHVLRVSPNELLSLSDALARILQNPAYGTQLAYAARTVCDSIWSWDAHTRSIEPLLNTHP